MRYVVLLRGINVGGNKRIKMADLRSALVRAGIDDPSTLLQSGNVVFNSNAPGGTITDIVEATIEGEFGFHCDVIVRTDQDLEAITTKHPFTGDQLTDPRMAHVVFLRGAPDRPGFDELRIANQGPEEMTLDGRELYIHYPDGSGSSRLTGKVIEKCLGTSGTARNWNTVLKIFDML